MTNAKRRKPARKGAKSRRKAHSEGGAARWWLLFFLVILFVGLVWYFYDTHHRAAAPSNDSPVAEAQDSLVTEAKTARHSPQDTPRGKEPKAKNVPETAPRPAPKGAKPDGPNKDENSPTPAVGRWEGASSIIYEAEAAPELLYSCASQTIVHRGYRLSYNADYKVPNWVFYELTRDELKGPYSRSDKFTPDPEIRLAQSAQLADYRRSGYDRGHIAPANDFTWDGDAMDESFYLSNMCPQTHAFNAGIWKTLEETVRRWADRDSAICIAAGPVLTPAGFPDEVTTIGAGDIVVPQYFYKVILAPFGPRPRAIGFIFPHANSRRPLADFAVTVDSVERMTMIDFFSVIPDDVEDAIEAAFDSRDWF